MFSFPFPTPTFQNVLLRLSVPWAQHSAKCSTGILPDPNWMELYRWLQLTTYGAQKPPSWAQSNHRITRIKIYHWFKPLNYKVICYTTTDNRNTVVSHPIIEQSYTLLSGTKSPPWWINPEKRLWPKRNWDWIQRIAELILKHFTPSIQLVLSIQTTMD